MNIFKVTVFISVYWIFLPSMGLGQSVTSLNVTPVVVYDTLFVELNLNQPDSVTINTYDPYDKVRLTLFSDSLFPTGKNEIELNFEEYEEGLYFVFFHFKNNDSIIYSIHITDTPLSTFLTKHISDNTFLYPNPTSGKVNLINNSTQIITIYNSNGTVVFNKVVDNGYFEIKVVPGQYFVQSTNLLTGEISIEQLLICN